MQTATQLTGRPGFSYNNKKYPGRELFIDQHLLGFQVSGTTHILHSLGHATITANTAVLIRRNQIIRITPYLPEKCPCQFLSFVLNKEMLQQLAFENSVIINGRYTPEQNLFFQAGARLKENLIALASNHRGDKHSTVQPVQIREIVRLLLEDDPDLKYLLFDFSAPPRTDVSAFMNQHFMFNMPISTFARAAGYRPAAFKKIFSERYHRLPKDWLIERRLAEAYHLISQKGHKAAAIYLDLGFRNLSHFYTAFKKRYGTTSSAIRQSACVEEAL
ncbi:helix-turn-helix domain-containing protein [Niabella beijingensis]|uniref:helix-turn-helix domain-containing protein n=1 Tax=Niabella beijingensis TaxID=2872700 RepID=UPI001CBED7BE|nr:AraC family transcriptional regulator [Niabella beijingensis]MBZ4192600.1 AraC family transcriptional regulator [Niabella beijingensis]